MDRAHALEIVVEPAQVRDPARRYGRTELVHVATPAEKALSIDDELAEALMLRHGISRDVVTALRAVSRSFRGWGGSACVDPGPVTGGVPVVGWFGMTETVSRLRVDPRYVRQRAKLEDVLRRVPYVGDHLASSVRLVSVAGVSGTSH